MDRLEAQPGTDRKVIGRMIDHLCEIMGSNAPSEAALQSYYAELEPYPQPLLIESFKRVSKTHKYPRFPFIADFLAVIKTEIAEQTDLHTKLKTMLILLRQK